MSTVAEAPQSPSSPAPSSFRLPYFAARLRITEKPVRVIALGSSTTAGEGGILAYPYRLEALLRARFAPQDKPRPMIDVLNRGIGGEEAPREFDRIRQDVVAEQPSLVIWQIGTNSVWQSPDKHPPSLAKTIKAVQQGIVLLQETCQADVILMDPQYVPAMLTREKIDATGAMVAAIATTANEMQVNLFQRFELMRRLHEVEKVPFSLLVDPTDDSLLHDSDWTTQWLTQSLMDQIVTAVERVG